MSHSLECPRRHSLTRSKENPMNEPIRQSPPANGRGTRKSLALLCTVLVVGIALLASRPAPPPAPADAAQDKKPGTPPPQAVAAANKFLDALDAKQREQALFEYDSPKKSAWSNLPVTIV